jgi:hypothetical protein
MGDGEQVRHRVDELSELPCVKQPTGAPVLHRDTESPGIRCGCGRNGESMVEPSEHARQHSASAHRIVPLVAGGSGYLSRISRADVQ